MVDNQTNKHSFDFTTELVIKSLSSKEITAIHSAIYPETQVEISTRGKAEITIGMVFSAIDFISLRAMVSSYLRWIDAAISSLEVI
ncbi:MAG: KEOPS complex subunit Pcc1 [Candidatus Heimdallarchaeota archaeon]